MANDGVTEGLTIAERFLHDASADRRTVSLYLVSGYQLKGEVISFDQESILFKHRGTHQLVLRSAVATMYPGKDGEAAAPWWESYVGAPVE